MTTSKFNQTAGWIASSSSHQIFHWIHYSAEPSTTAAIVIGSVGPEYMHCHRAVKHLAHSLQEKGIVTLRYDPVGFGNSSGSLFDSDLLKIWVDTIDSLKKYLIDNLGIKKITLIGFRSGALVAGTYLSQHAVDKLVYWYPVIRGDAHTRNMEVIDDNLGIDNDIDSYLNAGGYPLGRQMIDQLQGINLSKLICNVTENILLVQSSESKANKRLLDSFAQAGIENKSITGMSLTTMARQAELSRVPDEDIEAISNWISAGAGQEAVDVEAKDLPATRLRTPEFIESVTANNNPARIFGIHCRPVTVSEADEKPFILITNGGSGHHVGPNRLHTDVARQLALCGFSSIRFDLSTLGDSPETPNQSDNHPYPPDAVRDIGNMIAQAKKDYGATKFILAGLCSGAHSAFHAQLELNQYPVIETLLINPLTFYLSAGESFQTPDAAEIDMSQNYYKDQAKDFEVWMRFLTSPRKILKAGLFLLRYFFSKFFLLLRKTGQAAGLLDINPLQRDIEIILDNGNRITFFISDDDPGYAMIMREAKRAILKAVKTGKICIYRLAGDHTFSSYDSRRQLIDKIVHHITQRY